MRMITAALAPEAEGFEERTYECPRCAHVETRIEPRDPLESNATRWTAHEPGLPR
jgi:hypothetical protein